MWKTPTSSNAASVVLPGDGDTFNRSAGILQLGSCHGPTQAQGQYAQWARKHFHRESLREVSWCRHAALDRLLLQPTETFAGDPDHCRMMGDSPNDPGIANAWDSSDARGAHGDRPSRGA